MDTSNQTNTLLRGGNVEPVDEADWFSWLAFIIAVGAWFIIALLIRTCAYMICKQKDKVSSSCNQKRFDHTISKEKSSTSRRNSTSSSATVSPITRTIIYESYVMDCYIKYEDDGKTRSGFTKIQLKHNGKDHGYDISGMCADADGFANITDGHASYNGDAWWIQEVTGEDEERSGLKVCNQGTFNFALGRFDGSWVANTGSRGIYSKFEAKSINTILLAIPSKHVSFDVPVAIPMSLEQEKPTISEVDSSV